ncbi:hypothetical protein [Amycolatopsis alkalitolerans]|uniref:Uncharacterized protein n=1 Tax=Amycolatopsis alkalitolerans TaxID=2547244 RepID=A0A5C4LSE0_9PSEU|nr:hypothetical protein [Amycolatopsis alkalitolerans]TNC19069.1 hypothetical protein FG385_32910 [Amycolatopsis alkalitolerans]
MPGVVGRAASIATGASAPSGNHGTRLAIAIVLFWLAGLCFYLSFWKLIEATDQSTSMTGKLRAAIIDAVQTAEKGNA